VSRRPRRAWLALGGNLGDRAACLRAGVEGLRAGGFTVDAASSLYETPPWGVLDQPHFLNAAVSGETRLGPHDLLDLCKSLEAAAGRDFAAPRNSARPLDIDILLIEGEQVSAPDLQVPHVAMHARAFVLVPLAEIAGDVRHPHFERLVSELLLVLPETDVRSIRRVAGPEWAPLAR
jgi:2-amino-4-hydroxy-6-hydroxymethyldihydropteridine diphosphokinase